MVIINTATFINTLNASHLVWEGGGLLNPPNHTKEHTTSKLN